MEVEGITGPGSFNAQSSESTSEAMRGARGQRVRNFSYDGQQQKMSAFDEAGNPIRSNQAAQMDGVSIDGTPNYNNGYSENFTHGTNNIHKYESNWTVAQQSEGCLFRIRDLPMDIYPLEKIEVVGSIISAFEGKHKSDECLNWIFSPSTEGIWKSYTMCDEQLIEEIMFFPSKGAAQLLFANAKRAEDVVKYLSGSVNEYHFPRKIRVDLPEHIHVSRQTLCQVIDALNKGHQSQKGGRGRNSMTAGRANPNERVMLPHASLYDSGVTEPVSLGNKSNLGYKFWNIGKSRLLSDALSDYFDRNPRVFRNFMGPAYREGARFQRYTASWVIYQRGALANTENLFDYLKYNQNWNSYANQQQWNNLA